MTGRRKKRLRYAGWAAGVALLSLIASNAHQLSTARPPQFENEGAAPATEALTAIVEQYAPFIYHATDRSEGRQDVISNFDFDGDLVGNNNWENFQKYQLKPTVYYSALETETHYFISYHLFHPRDWNHFTVWLNDTHENDGENFQVVVRKGDSRVVLLWTQAHYKSRVYARPGSGVESAGTKIAGEFQTVDSDGLPSETGRHAAVFVESEGHGIYGTLDRDSEAVVKDDGSYSFKGRSGLLFRPARTGEQVREPDETSAGAVAYRLDSITVKLWPLLRDRKLTGDGRLLDGSYAYKDGLVEIEEVPRFYDADRFSGPFGSDRGISPFALDFSFEQGTLGALFFNPARAYAERLKISDHWSQQYINYPFAR
ncbi:MAG TPA: hypothetical protein VJZ26_09220 [Blastocatellia bacterium]|nr:hypothetical protein [Blastocatellia bacterium]